MTKSPPLLPPPPPRPPPPAQRQGVRCPRCDSSNTKFCYYNNYSLAQPRHFCKTCRRYWTQGGSLRNIPLGGSSRKIKKPAGISPSPEFQLAGLGQFYPPNLSPFGDHLNLNTAFAVGGPSLNVLGGGPFCYWKELAHEMGYYNEDNIYQKNEGVGVGPPDVMSDVFFENLEEEVGATNPHFHLHHHHDHHGNVVAGGGGGGHNAVDGDGGEISTKWLFGGGSSSCSNANNDESGDQNGDARICSSLTRRMSW